MSNVQLPWMHELVWPKAWACVPVVQSFREAARLLAHVPGEFTRFALLLSGSGLQLLECPRLRIEDPHLHRGAIVVHEGKVGKVRVVVLPASLRPAPGEQVAPDREVCALGRAADCPGVALRHALTRKRPNAGKSSGWFWLWSSHKELADPRTGTRRRRDQRENRADPVIPHAADR